MNKETGLQLALDAATGWIRASYRPSPEGDAPALGLDALQEAFAGHGWHADALDHEAALLFLDACRRTEDAVEPMRIGEIRDGRYDLDIEADAMTAYLTIEPPRGGHPVTVEQIRQALAQHGIVYGVDEALIRQAVEAGHCTALVVARGDPPRPGTPTRFESLLPMLRQRQQAADSDNGRVDYRDLGNLVVVTPGTPLMRRIPAQAGQEGRTLRGDALPASPVSDIPFPPGLVGVALDEEDPCLLVATQSGVPRELGQGVCVDPVLEVESVDLSTGNIDFDGTLKVRRDIKAGMSVKVAGDILVQGTIEAAHVVAGGDVKVAGGVIGGAEALSNDSPAAANTLNTRAAYIRCDGNLEARFLDNAVINVGRAVRILGEIRQCDIAAGDSIEAGAQQGAILGGRCRALRAVRAGTMGSVSNLPTVIQVGLNPHAAARRAEISRERAAVEDERAKLEKLLAFFQANPDKGANGVADRVRLTYAATDGKLQELDERDAALTAEIALVRSAVIQATRRFFGGVKLQIGSRTLALMENHPGGQAMLDEDAVVIR